MTAYSIDHVRDRDDVVVVSQNDVGMAVWPPNGRHRFLATEGLNGCTGVAIISSLAGILGHIAPFPLNAPRVTGNQDPGAQNLITKMQQIVNYYNANKGLFPESQSLIVAAFFQGRQALPEHIRFITRALETLGLPVTVKSYNVLNAGTARASGQTSIVIVPQVNRRLPKIFVNDVEVDLGAAAARSR